MEAGINTARNINMKETLTIMGIDAATGFVVYFIEPSFLKYVYGMGFASLIALFMMTKQGKVSIYGSQLAMALTIAIHFAK